MDERLVSFERRLQDIEMRNARVEADKAWETSVFRRVIIAGLTYAVAVPVLASIGSVRPFLDAAIPTIGYVLSVQSIPYVKRWWLEQRRH